MAVAVEQTATVVSTSTSGTSFTGSSFTVGSASDRALALVLSSYMTSSTGTPGATSVSHNGESLTAGPRGQNGKNWVEIWYLANPTSGAGTTSITTNDTCSNVAAFLVEASGVDGTTPIMTSTFGDNLYDDNAVVSLTTTADDALIIGGISVNTDDTPFTVSGGGTKIAEAGLSASSHVSAYEAIATAGADGFTFSWAGFDKHGLAAIAFAPAAGGGGDTNVSANTEALTLTQNAASISFDVNVNAATEALTLTALAAGVSLDTNVLAATEALTLTPQTATITVDTNVEASAEALTLTALPASIAHDINVTAATEALTLTALQADVTLGVNILAETEALLLTANPAAVSLDVNVAANVEALTLTAFPADVALGTNVLANVEALTLTTFAADVTSDVNVAANTKELTLTALPANVSLVRPVINRGDDAGRPSPRETFWQRKAEEWIEENLAEAVTASKKRPKARKKAVKAFMAEAETFADAPPAVALRVDYAKRIFEQIAQPDFDRLAVATAVAAEIERIERDRVIRRRKRDLEAVIMVAA